MKRPSKMKAALDGLFSSPAPVPASIKDNGQLDKDPAPAPAKPARKSTSAQKSKSDGHKTAIIPDTQDPANHKETVAPAPTPAIEDQKPEPIAVIEETKPAAVASPADSKPASQNPLSDLPVNKPAPQAVKEALKPDVQAGKPAETADILAEDEIEQLVIFKLAEELYGLKIDKVEGIIKPQAITPVPHTKKHIIGVTNLRGTVLPVIDLRVRFGLPPAKTTEDTRVVVIKSGDLNAGLMVDEVTQVAQIPVTAIDHTPSITISVDSNYVRGLAKHEDRIVILLELEKVLSSTSQRQNK